MKGNPHNMPSASPDQTALQAIDDIRRVLLNPYCRTHMNTSGLKGFLGELLVRKLLQSASHAVRHLGNQHGTDLEIPELNISLDVKTSVLKEEIPGCQHWGWALISGSKRKELKFTHVVCVALGDDLDIAELFVVRREELAEFPGSIPPFTKNKNILIVPKAGQSPPETAKKYHKQLFEDCAALEKRGKFRRASDAPQLISILKPTD